MRVFTILVAVMVIQSKSAAAQSWMEYDYPDADFSIHFPAAPGVTGGLYETGAGMFVGARIYSHQVPGSLLTVTVADLSGTGADQENTLV
jgi:hypothetical protein